MLTPSLDSLTLLALTVWGEARGEPFDGKLAVAFCVRNRIAQAAATRQIGDIVLAPKQFSFWNDDSRPRMQVDRIDIASPVWAACYAAACGAIFADLLGVVDPSKGANHYLNEQVVLMTAGKLPSWFDEGKIVARVGAHTFLKL